MKSIFKILVALVLIISMMFSIISCSTPTDNTNSSNNTNDTQQKEEGFYIEGSYSINVVEGQTLTLTVVIPDGIDGDVTWTSSHSCVSVEDGKITAIKEGTAVIQATLGDLVDRVVINVSAKPNSDVEEDEENNNTDNETPDEDYVFGSEYPCITIAEALEIAEQYTSSASTEKYYIVATVTNIISLSKGEMYISDETSSLYVYKSTYYDGSSLSASAIDEGYVILICGTLRNYKGTLEIEKGSIIAYYHPDFEEPPKPGQGGNDSNGNTTPDNPGEDVIVPDENDPVQSDPYVNVNVSEFYANYAPAISYMDAYYRTQHGLLSGNLDDQDQAPTISNHRPTSDGKYIRNNVYLFSEDGNTYYVVDCYGEIAFEIYKGGAYILLEEVAAYVFAFGEPPANHSYSKKTQPTDSIWGEFLRVNNTKFSGDTSKYPYEPVLPRISGCGGDLTYYEMDIGTTGTDCDPSYPSDIYNDGYSITRGAARIVYSCYDRNGNKIIDLDERYVFYTYNHYNDFQEYLNYEGGWGEMFGNITGGGIISDKYFCNPTDYVEVVRGTLKVTITTVVVYAYFPKEELVA